MANQDLLPADEWLSDQEESSCGFLLSSEGKRQRQCRSSSFGESMLVCKTSDRFRPSPPQLAGEVPIPTQDIAQLFLWIHLLFPHVSTSNRTAWRNTPCTC